MASLRLADDPVEYVAVGTAIVHDDEPEPNRGQVLLLSPQTPDEGSKCFSSAASLEVPGAVYALTPFRGMLLGCVNNRIYLWSWSDAAGHVDNGRALKEVCRHTGGTISLLVSAAMDDYVLVGDLMRSATLFHYSSEPPKLDPVASDEHPAWLTAMETMTETSFLFSDDCSNLVTLARQGEENSGGRHHAGDVLTRVGQFHSGEFVNRLQRGTFGQQPKTDLESANSIDSDSIVWASVSGALGLVLPLKGQQQFERLSLLQDAVLRELSSLGKVVLPYDEWRNHWAGSGATSVTSSSSTHRGFIDGGLLELFLSLPHERQAALVQSLPMELELQAVLQEVEGLAQLH
eukprot:CAMPEP_0197687992 /NCGR_PEP_ID=MMETSP1338-20131121/104761_1 /TAXON_ID=43686 ORGANISM="Pelagodinium beii, Strain RCC1491" /NCGR_SAMPLE_ID=MMETSP1338 /ASSEMBLY_ACC=CAM_ASM_000754 /LENGTH=346 /DNA_ID=CAMNT_0043270157 /DNA_START=9 /DNA_END=1049 /DNA_ORIENTATION=-